MLIAEVVWFDGTYETGRTVESLTDNVVSVREINGAGFALRLSAYQDLGGFDERYFLYHEEVDWSRRAKLKGWDLAVVEKSRLIHERAASGSSNGTVYYKTRNRYLLLRKGLGEGATYRSLTKSEILAALRLRGGGRRAAFQGVLDGLRGQFGPRPVASPSLLAMGPRLAREVGFMLLRLKAN